MRAFVDPHRLLPQHDCARCGRTGSVPLTLRWSHDAPFAAYCFPMCEETEPVTASRPFQIAGVFSAIAAVSLFAAVSLPGHVHQRSQFESVPSPISGLRGHTIEAGIAKTNQE